MTVAELATILGENLKNQASRNGDYWTEPGPRIDYETDEMIVPDTLVMSIDGQVDLMELARAVMVAR